MLRHTMIIAATLCLLTHTPEATTPTAMDVEQNASWVTYAPQTRYINQSGPPLVAQDGSIWWPLRESSRGLGFNGALQYDGKAWLAYTSKDGLFDGPVRAIAQATDGTLWFAGSHKDKAAIANFDGQNWTIHTNPLTGKTTGNNALVDSQGHLWVSTEHTDLEAAETDSSKGGNGIFRYDGTRWTHLTVADGLTHNRVYDIDKGRDGVIWIATYKGLNKYDPKTNSWITYTTADGLGKNKIYRVLASREGLVWCTHGGNAGISVYNHHEWQHITQNDGLPTPSVRTIAQTQDGVLWFGTHPQDGSSGLIRQHRGNWLRLLTKDGLPHNHIVSVVEDATHALWVYTAPNRFDRYTPNFSTLQTATGTLREEGELLKNVGLHLVDSNGEVRAGTTTDINGRYRLPMFVEDYTVVPLQTRKLDPELVKNLTGTWMGNLTLPGIELRIVFHIEPDSVEQLSATLDSPDQGVADIATDEISVRRQKLRIGIHRIRGTYEGTLNSKDKPTQITGTWKQMGREMALVLAKTDQAPTINRPQEPQKPYPYHSENITFENSEANIELAGTLTRPKNGGPFPAVLLISGSGAQDRDEALMGHKPFLVLADHLTRKGIAVLRVDDRGAGKSTGKVVKELPQLNHLFQTATTGSLSEYGKIEETFAPLALNTISDWIENQIKK